VKSLNTQNKAATFIAILFHVSGWIGICFSPFKDWFIQNTSLNILLMTGLIFWTQTRKRLIFYLFFLACFLVGIGVEMIGVNTAKLFGHYAYGMVMGKKLNGVPWLIGLNWFLIIFCSGSVIQQFHRWIIMRLPEEAAPVSNRLIAVSTIIDGALLAVFFDWVMEPMAIKLGFWKWAEEAIPAYNYLCWFLISTALLTLFRLCAFQKINQFAVHLFIIQLLFFLALRTF
jgi:putative membrane protein